MPYFTNLKDCFILREFWFIIWYVPIYNKYCNKTSETHPSQTIREISETPMVGYISKLQAIFKVLVQIKIIEPKPFLFQI